MRTYKCDVRKSSKIALQKSYIIKNLFYFILFKLSAACMDMDFVFIDMFDKYVKKKWNLIRRKKGPQMNTSLVAE